MSTVQVRLTEFSELVERYTTHFVGREWLAQQVDTLLEDPGCRFVVITGDAGVGKTAFMAHLAKNHPGWPRYFIRRDSRELLRPGDANTFLLTAGGQLATIHPELFKPERLEVVVRQRIGDLEASGEAVAVRIKDLQASPFCRVAIRAEQEIQRMAGKATGVEIGRLIVEPRGMRMQDLQCLGLLDPAWLLYQIDPKARIVVLVDALDELRYSPAEEDLLRALCEMPVGLISPEGLKAASPGRKLPEMPPNLRFVVTSRREKFLDRLLGRSDVRELPLAVRSEENLADLGTYARTNLPEDGLELVLAQEKTSREEFLRDVLGKAAGNFLYLRSVLDAIREALADPEKGDRLRSLLRVKDLPDDLDALYDYFLASIVDWVKKSGFGEAAWRQYLRPLLGTLAVAHEPLSEEQLIAFTGLESEDLGDLLRELRQFVEPVDGRQAYRIYHTSFAEYLLDAESNADYRIDGRKWHGRIAGHYRDRAPTWAEVDWSTCDVYGLRHLAMHLGEAVRGLLPMKRQKKAKKLHKLVQCAGYGQAKLKRVADPGALLGDLQLAVEVALEDLDLARVWQHILRYRQIMREERITAKTFSEARRGQYESALNRTALYNYMPTSQALMRLWIAWVAASDCDADGKLATRAAERALADLPSLDTLGAEAGEEDADGRYLTRDAATEAICRLLIRTARKIRVKDKTPRKWLEEVGQACQAKNVEPIREKVNQLWSDWDWESSGPTDRQVWGSLLTSEDAVKALLEDLINFRQAGMVYRDELAGGIAETWQDPKWQSYVSRAVDLVALDDYPSYRERALAWLACAVLMQESEKEAQEAMCLILSGALDRPEPTFGGDLPAAVLHAAARTRGCLLTGKQLWGLVQKVRDYEPTPDPAKAGGGSGSMRLDPWAQERRTLSAYAAVLWRLGARKPAEEKLEEAGSQDLSRGYAGYRALARLALACRWLEWGRKDKAREEIKLARSDAKSMIDAALQQERESVVEAMHRWWKCYSDDADAWSDADFRLQQAQKQAGMERSVYLMFLSAIWSSNPDRLKRLVPLALDDRTACDAILGRLVGALIHEEALSRPQVDHLLKKMQLVDLVEQVLTEGG